jgi:NADH:quinone reductase (non-electrogenic)
MKIATMTTPRVTDGGTTETAKTAYDAIAETPSSNDASLHRVVIVGGGAGGLELATQLGGRFGKRQKASITLVDQTRIHVWKPLLHEIASGSLNSDTDSIEFIAHARRHNYRYRIGAVIGLDRAKHQILVAPSVDEEGQQIIPPRVLGYDTLVVAVGSVSNEFGTPGAAEHAIALDTAEQAGRFNRRMINACLRANAQYEPLRPGQLHCAIVGAGATGVELAAELHRTMRDIASYNLDHIDFDKLIRITIIEAGRRILPALPDHLAASTAKLLQDLGVDIRCGSGVTEVTPHGVKLADMGSLGPEKFDPNSFIGRQIHCMHAAIVYDSLGASIILHSSGLDRTVTRAAC